MRERERERERERARRAGVRPRVTTRLYCLCISWKKCLRQSHELFQMKQNSSTLKNENLRWSRRNCQDVAASAVMLPSSLTDKRMLWTTNTDWHTPSGNQVEVHAPNQAHGGVRSVFYQRGLRLRRGKETI